MTEINIQKRGRGRPKGSKDSKPRQYRSALPKFEGNGDRVLSVEDKLRMLKRPVRASVIAEITGLSESTILRRASEPQTRSGYPLMSFYSRGIRLFDPKYVLDWWTHRLQYQEPK